jgi:hypothetical protein
VADEDKDRPDPISPLDIRSVSPLAPGAGPLRASAPPKGPPPPPPTTEHVLQRGDLGQYGYRTRADETLPPVLPPVPDPSSGQPMHLRDRWLFLVLAWMPIPAGIFVVGFVALYSGAPHWGAAGIFIGLLGMSAATLHLWENKPRSPHPGPFQICCAVLTWLFVGWQTWLVFHHPMQGYTQTQLDKAVEDGKAPIQSKLDDANRQLEGEKIKSLIPSIGPVSGGQVVSELRDLRTQVDELKRQNDALRQTPPTPSFNHDSGPIKWEPVLWFPAPSVSGVRFIMLRGENSSGSPVQLKSASFTSALTGESRNLSINIPYGNLDGEKFPVGDANPIPAGAKIQLVSEWTPPISVQEFMNRWGKISLTMDYDDTKYRKIIDPEFMKTSLLRDIVGADLVLGVPRVTKKESAK